MVKGISRQVIVVQSPEPKMFEQAIRGYDKQPSRKRHFYLYGAVWATGGALLTGLAWLLTAMF